MSGPLPAWARDLLRDGRVARLGTADRLGQPLVVPVCYAWDGERAYSAVDAKPKRTRALRRLRNVEENPRASLLVDAWDEDWTRLCWVLVEGRADVLVEGPERARALGLLLAKYAQYRVMRLEREAGPVVRLAAERVLHWRPALAASRAGPI